MEQNNHKTRKRAGVCITHRRALIVLFTNGEPRTLSIDSEFEGNFKPHRGGIDTQNGHVNSGDEATAHNRRREQLKAFYRNVIKEIQDAEEVLIMGGGMAKNELENEIQEHGNQPLKIVGILAVSEMTDDEIIAEMKNFYKIPIKRQVI